MKKSHIAALGLVVALVSGAPAVTALAADTEAATPIPATSAEIWKAIDVHMNELHMAINQGKLNTVHQHAFAVRDLVRALPTHSAALSPAALAKVKTQGKFVDTLAERLDQSGDSGDKAATEDNTHKLEAVLKTIRAQYP